MDEIILKKKGWPEVTIELVKTCGVSLTAEVESSTGWVKPGPRVHARLLAAPDAAKSFQSCLTLCDPIDGSPPGFPVPGILQARTPGWVAISLSDA